MHFSFVNKTTKWPLIWFFWLLVAMVFTAAVVVRGGSVYGLSLSQLFARNLLITHIWLLLTPLAIYLARKFPVSFDRYKYGLLIHAFSSCLIAIIHVAIYTLVVVAMNLAVVQGSFLQRFEVLLTFNFGSNIVFYFLILGSVLVLDTHSLNLESRPGLAESRLEDEDIVSSHSSPKKPIFGPTSKAIAGESKPLTRIPVKTGGRITFVNVDDIDLFEADDNYVRIVLGTKTHLIRDKLGQLETQLDPSSFLRIHRSVIINTRRIKELRAMPGSIFEVVLTGGSIVRSGRSYRERFASLLRE